VPAELPELFRLDGRVAVITGGGGLLGEQHAAAIAGAGGIPVLVDISAERAQSVAARIAERFGVAATAVTADITSDGSVREAARAIAERFGRIDILVNNAANDPKFEADGEVAYSRLEHFPFAQWQADLAVGLTGAFLCSQIFGSAMARAGRGVIVNVASDLALIGPDQRIYRQPGTADDAQPTKPVTYSVVKAGLLGLTRYLATYWAERGVRANAISPGGVYTDQSDVFVKNLTSLIPLNRMAKVDEYQGAMLFLCSDASAYMTGSNLVIDGGRTCW
jgi:NAD(P)-dependent dehydrogenase (short-subunit alcohol dehydrogenase family)